jgi:hypothetical protein
MSAKPNPASKPKLMQPLRSPGIARHCGSQSIHNPFNAKLRL